MKASPLLAIAFIGMALVKCAPSLVQYKEIGKGRKVDSAAGVVGNASMEINAPPEIIWDCLVDVQAWPEWNPGIKSVQAKGPLTQGMAFTWGPSTPRIRSEVVYFQAGREVVWIGRMLHIKAIHKWSLSPSLKGNATTVATEESLDGTLVSLLFGRKKLQSDLDKWLRHLKNQAEAQYMAKRENSALMLYRPY